MKKKKLLFVCSKNKLRSPTAEQIFSAYLEFEVLSAGTAPEAVSQLDAEMIEWADYIFVMESVHQHKMREKFRKNIKNQKIISLNIPDDYGYMDPALVDLLEARVLAYFKIQK